MTRHIPHAASGTIIAALAVWTRSATAPRVFEGGEVTAVEVDAFLHLRRIARTVEAFPTVPWRDPWIDWPNGVVIPWPEGFDWLIAAAARLLSGGASHRAEVVAAWAPAVLGAAVALWTWSLTARLLRGVDGASGAALLAGLFVALAPQSVATALVGRVDHHVAEQLVVLALVGWCAARPDGDADTLARWRFEALGACALGLAVWCFNGSVLYAAMACAVLAAAPLVRRDPQPAVGSGALAFALSSLFVAWRARGAVAAHGAPFDHLATSYLQPTLLALAGAFVGAACAITRLRPRGATSVAHLAALRASALVGVGVGAATLLLAAAPAVRAEITSGLRRWLARDDGYMASIVEVQPLFSRALGRSPAESVRYAFGVAGLFLPFVGTLGLVWFRRRRGALALAVFSVGLTALWVAQMRFGRALAPIAGVCLGVGAAAISARLADARARRGLPMILALALLLDPRSRAWFPRRPPTQPPEVIAARLVRALVPPGEAVFTTWPDANAVSSVGARPVLVSSFGSYTAPETFWRAERAWLGDEDALVDFLAPRGVRWMLAGATHLGGSAVAPHSPEALARDGEGRRAFNLDFFRRTPLAALVLGGSGPPRTGVAHLRRWMPRAAVGLELQSAHERVPSLWLYERVAGATLTGQGAPGAIVTLTTPLRVDGFANRHVAWTRVARDGWRLTVALPTSWRSQNLSTGSATLRVGDGPPRVVEVTEAAVRGGERIAAP